MTAYKIGIDLGGTKTEALLLDANDRQAHRKRVPTPSPDGYETILELVSRLVRETASRVPAC